MDYGPWTDKADCIGPCQVQPGVQNEKKSSFKTFNDRLTNGQSRLITKDHIEMKDDPNSIPSPISTIALT